VQAADEDDPARRRPVGPGAHLAAPRSWS
jgi:hypothetical protein